VSLNAPKALSNLKNVARLASEAGTTADGIKAAA